MTETILTFLLGIITGAVITLIIVIIIGVRLVKKDLDRNGDNNKLAMDAWSKKREER